MTITVDFGILAILVSLVCIAYMAYHAKNEDRRFKAILEYIDKCDEKRRKDFREEMADLERRIVEKNIAELNEKVEQGLSEINPNFAAAKNAMGQVNDMAAGLANLFSFDPVESLRKLRGDGE